MGLFDRFKSEAETVDDVSDDQNMDKIVEYLTERMTGMDNRMEDIESRFSDMNREGRSRTDALYSEVW